MFYLTIILLHLLLKRLVLLNFLIYKFSVCKKVFLKNINWNFPLKQNENCQVSCACEPHKDYRDL